MLDWRKTDRKTTTDTENGEGEGEGKGERDCGERIGRETHSTTLPLLDLSQVTGHSGGGSVGLSVVVW